MSGRPVRLAQDQFESLRESLRRIEANTTRPAHIHAELDAYVVDSAAQAARVAYVGCTLRLAPWEEITAEERLSWRHAARAALDLLRSTEKEPTK